MLQVFGVFFFVLQSALHLLYFLHTDSKLGFGFTFNPCFLNLSFTLLCTKYIQYGNPFGLSIYSSIDNSFINWFIQKLIFDNKDLSCLLHRFYGVTKDGKEFCVQVKQNKRSGRKDFILGFDRKHP